MSVLDFGKCVGKKPGFWGKTRNRVSILSWDLGKYLGRGKAFRRINYGKKLEIYDRNASPLCKEETGFLFYFWTSANIWGRNPVSGFLAEFIFKNCLSCQNFAANNQIPGKSNNPKCNYTNEKYYWLTRNP